MIELRAWLGDVRTRGVFKLIALALWPVVAVALAMKVSRIALLPEQITWTDRLLCLAPDVLYGFGLTCLAITLLDQPRLLWRRVALVMVQLLALLTFAIDVLVFGYYRATGLVLDYETIALSLTRVEEIAPVVTSEITRGMAFALSVVPLWLLITPWLPWTLPKATTAAQRPFTRRWLANMLLIAGALGCFALSYSIAIASVPVSFAHDAVLHLVGDVLKPAPVIDESDTPPPRHTGPDKLIKTSATKNLNVAVIVLESTRYDATTAYKPGLLTTPFLAELAKTGTLVERAYAIVPHTSKALVAMLCGFEPRPTPEIVEATAKGMPGRCLADLLSEVGYDSAYFQAPKGMFEQRPQLVKNMGYREFRASETMPKTGFASVNYFGYEDAIMLGPSEEWLTKKAREPFFATYLTSASHHPYGVPPSHVPQTFSRGRNNKYLNAVNYVDGVVKQIIDQYKAAGLYERTIFVVVGDHGEGFNEHRLSTHDDVIYEEGLRVPLIIRAPGRSDLPSVVKGPLNQLDIVPTILSLLGLHAVGGRYEGQSIYADKGTTPLYAACHRNAQCMATIRGDYKLLYFFDDKPTLLFNLKKDPRERHNIADQHPNLVRQWTADVQRWTLAVQEAHKSFSYATIANFVSARPPKISEPLGANVSGMFEVVGCVTKRLHRSKLEVTCHYHVLGEVDDALRIRVRGTVTSGDNAGAQRVFDHRPVRGLYPLRDWKPGEYVSDKFDVYAPLSWEHQDASLCLLVERNKAALNVSPAPPSGDNCIPFSDVPARMRPAPKAP